MKHACGAKVPTAKRSGELPEPTTRLQSSKRISQLLLSACSRVQSSKRISQLLLSACSGVALKPPQFWGSAHDHPSFDLYNLSNHTVKQESIPFSKFQRSNLTDLIFEAAVASCLATGPCGPISGFSAWVLRQGLKKWSWSQLSEWTNLPKSNIHKCKMSYYCIDFFRVVTLINSAPSTKVIIRSSPHWFALPYQLVHAQKLLWPSLMAGSL